MIEQKYNQIWHRIKDNIKYSCKSQLYNPFGTKGYKLYDLDSCKMHSPLDRGFYMESPLI